MKTKFKKAAYWVFRGLSKINTKKFAHSLINLGYLFNSEKHFNDKEGETLGWDRVDFHNYLSKEKYKPEEEIIFLEFGVYWGHTFNIWRNNNTNVNSFFGGFDTFSGLPEDWGNVKSGNFSAEGKLPDVDGDSRVKFYPGLIQDTLPVFLKSFNRDESKRLIVHIDVDLYNATLIILILLNPVFKKGDIVIFDDFYTLTKTEHEFRAYLDYKSLYNRKLKTTYKVNHAHFVMEFE